MCTQGKRTQLQITCILYSTNLVLFRIVANHLQGEPVRFFPARLVSLLSCVCFFALGFPVSALAQERPYVVTYDHYLEEPGNLEVEYFSNFGTQRGGNN